DMVLRMRGYIVNHKKILRIMNKLNITCKKFTRKSRKYSSYKGKIGKVAKNRINRRFNTHIPYQKITTDTTEFKYYTKDKNKKPVIKKAYLDPYLDMFNGEILSISIIRTTKCKSDFRRTRRDNNNSKELPVSNNDSYRSRLGVSDESFQ